MPVLLVTYELKNASQDYSTFLGMLQSYPNLQVTDTTLLVQTVDTPSEFFDGIWPFVDPNDQILIFEVDSKCYISGNSTAAAWIRERCQPPEPVAA